MNAKLKVALAISTLFMATQAVAQITFYEGEGFRGRVFATNKKVPNLDKIGFNDRASSVVVERGSWEVCQDAKFAGRCVILRKGSYDSLSQLGMNDRISSVRPADDRRRYENEVPAPLTAPNYEYRRRPSEKVYDVPVTSVRAVMGPPEQRCWVERQQVSEPGRGDPNVGGAIVGAILGGVLGHQVGSGRGNTLATAGGAVAGGVVGANVGRSSGGTTEHDVQRCENVASDAPAYWDVTYDFKGVQHRVQMSAAPGRTIAVNRNGEPRQ
ncbi:MAG: glycine zipper 2TM domain-containing protein [Betaproteobacteria bacterium]|nr:glycine zipper 2TM domain-containing protein [Betaproteobacteria bacterium]